MSLLDVSDDNSCGEDAEHVGPQLTSFEYLVDDVSGQVRVNRRLAYTANNASTFIDAAGGISSQTVPPPSEGLNNPRLVITNYNFNYFFGGCVNIKNEDRSIHGGIHAGDNANVQTVTGNGNSDLSQSQTVGSGDAGKLKLITGLVVLVGAVVTLVAKVMDLF